MPRTQTKEKAINMNPIPLPLKNSQVNKADIKRILIYSANMTNANPPPPYSVLYPETNSDSPSARSNGVRLVSAKQDTKNMIATSGMRQINDKGIW